jgi:cyclopropane fatty-acyl-phospholipid synthase-like methyltransferase
MKEFWNERYAHEEFAYGRQPNVFLAEELAKLTPGSIILPCDGEGRNAAYAAAKGWSVKAFDFSESAVEKAQILAKQQEVKFEIDCADAKEKEYDSESVDVVALIYAHLPEETRKALHAKAVQWLKPGGLIILEAFNSHQLNNASGGPKNDALLYTKEMLQNDFHELKIEYLEYLETSLSEGKFHHGNADVVRMLARKI